MKNFKKIVLTFALFIAILMPSTIFASTTTVKIKLPVPSKVTDTYAKVVHKCDEKVLDTKEYEIKSNESGKYIEIDTKSFSTFEVSFYAPVKVENPKTGDNIFLYITIGIIAIAGIGYTVISICKRKNN